MNRNWIRAISAAGLLSLSLLLAGCNQQSRHTEADASGGRSGNQSLEPFTSIELDVQAPHIRLEAGEEHSICYSLHSRETIKELEVRDGVLHFKTGLDPKWKPDGSDHEVVLTVPETAELGRVSLRSTAGDVSLNDRTVGEAVLTSISGDVSAEQLEASYLEVNTVSGMLTVTDCQADCLVGNNTSGGLQASGTFGAMEGRTVSGAVELTGRISTEMKLKTVSGNIRVEAPYGTLTAESVGGIRLNGEKQGGKLNLGSGAPVVDLSSASGKISIDGE